MPPRKRARGGIQTGSSSARTPPARNDDAMDIDTPEMGNEEEVASSPGKEDEGPNYNDCWTDDQVASLFKGVIRWKPAGKFTDASNRPATCRLLLLMMADFCIRLFTPLPGMHKHFRIIAISEHLRNHGFDPDHYKHTRIPYIWQKLRSYYNLDMIDEREALDDDEPEDRYVEFSLPRADFYEAMMQRALANLSEAPTSPPELDVEGSTPAPTPATSATTTAAAVRSSPLPLPSNSNKRRKRADTVSRTRATSRDGTEEATDAQSTAGRSRGSRGRTRAASAAKVEKAETTEEEQEEEEQEQDGEEGEAEDTNEESESDDDGDDDDDDDDDQPESDEETAAKPSRPTRGGARGRAARGRARGGRRRAR
ncbi:MRG-binding protein [Geosmithia morbida]|uniref:MRG-binding protein n=1 Tax=Geosmithia morbida TaxID=1094350 RepID=A0A9P5D8H2_9HYPO|nr:MRG-binding protein [Geosmithia morbida]KAF4126785.1 MRG-binding protein [Geosmithia morbida]